jgi:hypothetical protein
MRRRRARHRAPVQGLLLEVIVRVSLRHRTHTLRGAPSVATRRDRRCRLRSDATWSRSPGALLRRRLRRSSNGPFDGHRCIKCELAALRERKQALLP